MDAFDVVLIAISNAFHGFVPEDTNKWVSIVSTLLLILLFGLLAFVFYVRYF